MRQTALKRNPAAYIGLAATLLLLGLFFWWNLNHAVTAYAFDPSANGVYQFTDNEKTGGYIEDDANPGLRVYYQIDVQASSQEKGAYISGYEYFGGSEVTTMTLPDTITHPDSAEKDAKTTPYPLFGINGGAFRNFDKLRAVVFPASCRSIGAEAFMNCGLTGNLSFSNGVTEIHDRAFYNCTGIVEASIGANVTTIGNGVFANCSGLTGISVNGGNRNFSSDDFVLYSYDKTKLIQWPAAKSGTVTIGVNAYPATGPAVRVIGARAFEGSTHLMGVTINSSVTTIGERAFYGCTGLGQVKIPDTVLTIDNEAFGNRGSGLVFVCNKASAAERYANSYGIPTQVTCTVRFYDGASLIKTEEVSLGGSASAPILNERAGYTLTWDKDYSNVQQNLDVRAQWKQNFMVTFKDSYSGQVSQVASYYGGSATPPNWTREGYILGWDTTAYTYVTKDLTVNAVWLVSMTDGTISDDKPKVGDTRTINYITYQVTNASADNPRAKAVNCTKQTLTSLTIPDTITFGGLAFKVTNIGVNAFRDMPKLKKLAVGKHVMKINRAAFYNCPKLSRITIHSRKLTSVSAKAFSKIYAKAKINVPNAYISKYKKLLLDGGLSTSAKVY